LTPLLNPASGFSALPSPSHESSRRVGKVSLETEMCDLFNAALQIVNPKTPNPNPVIINRQFPAAVLYSI
jgi:hypothetical protein